MEALVFKKWCPVSSNGGVARRCKEWKACSVLEHGAKGLGATLRCAFLTLMVMRLIVYGFCVAEVIVVTVGTSCEKRARTRSAPKVYFWNVEVRLYFGFFS